MGGAGSIQSMNTILRNNRNLLRKKSIFKRDNSFMSARKKYLKAAKGEIDFKNISKEELRAIRKKVIKEQKTENLRAWIITLVLLVPIFAFGIYISNQLEFEKQLPNNMNQELIIEQQFEEKVDDYYFYIDEGDFWIEKQHWKNAIYQYKNAVGIFPEKYEANYRLALAYSYNCKFAYKDCKKGAILVDRLLKVNPNNKDLLALEIIVEK